MNIHQRRRAARAAALEAEQAVATQVVEEVKLTKDSLGKLGKDELEQLARDKFGIELDKRKTKAALIKSILEAQG